MFDSIRTISYYKTLISFYNNQQISNHNEPLFPSSFTNPSIFCFQRLLPIIITFLLFHFLTHRKIARTMTVIFSPRLCLFCFFFFFTIPVQNFLLSAEISSVVMCHDKRYVLISICLSIQRQMYTNAHTHTQDKSWSLRELFGLPSKYLFRFLLPVHSRRIKLTLCVFLDTFEAPCKRFVSLEERLF